MLLICLKCNCFWLNIYLLHRLRSFLILYVIEVKVLIIIYLQNIDIYNKVYRQLYSNIFLLYIVCKYLVCSVECRQL